MRSMSTVSEIEAALDKLTAEELARVEAALRRRREEVSTRVRDFDVAELERSSGFDVFPERTGPPVTIETVRRLCAEEDI